MRQKPIEDLAVGWEVRQYRLEPPFVIKYRDGHGKTP
jgi:hypothetical protein